MSHGNYTANIVSVCSIRRRINGFNITQQGGEAEILTVEFTVYPPCIIQTKLVTYIHVYTTFMAVCMNTLLVTIDLYKLQFKC